MGWNDIEMVNYSPILKGLGNAKFYFLHSYCVAPDDKGQVIARTHYGEHFPVAASMGSIYGTQFHPEKSHHWGLSLLRNFAEEVTC
jgi:glutamine amidotransferase